MIVVDFSQVCISNLYMSLGKHMSNDDIQIGLLRHFILNSIRGYNSKFKKDYGEMVLACDDRYSWRKDSFPYYKANRKKNRDESPLDWSAIFEILETIKAELKEYFPFRVIQVPKAEGDDIIGTMCHNFGNTREKILILSGDKDMRQLQRYVNVKQYDPVQKKWMTENQPERFLKEHIIRGDRGDGIPSILAKDDLLVLGERAPTMTQKRFNALMNEPIIEEKLLRNFKRNEQLIDLTFTPQEIQEKILTEFNNQAGKDRSHLMNYFITNKLKNLMESIGDF